MLEALAEAAAWLVRDAQGFSSSLILLRRVKNVTYKSFVKPGNLLRVEVACRRLAEEESDFAGVGTCNEEEAVRGRFSLTHFTLGQRGGAAQRDLSRDKRLVEAARAEFALLYR
jgi:3-hydroxyacyl-[acyl-carrier-protein] dehydratase